MWELKVRESGADNAGMEPNFLKREEERRRRVAEEARATLCTSPKAWSAPAHQASYFPRQVRKATSPGEQSALDMLASVVDTLDLSRGREDTVRGLAARAGVAPSAVNALLRGQRWPSVQTLGRVAATLGHRLLVAETRPVPAPRAVGARVGSPPDRRGREEAARHEYERQEKREGQARAGALAGVWHDLIVEELFWRLDHQGITHTQAAAKIGVARSCISEARAAGSSQDTWVSAGVVLALASLVKVQVRAVAMTKGWPRAPWEGMS